MKIRWIGLVAYAAALLLAGCGDGDKDGNAQAASPTLAATPSDPNEVTIAVDSPKLGRLQVAPAELAQVPIAEVASPGKVEANPNRLSHVVLPVAGRVISVSVKIGDYVRQGQTVLTVESPEVDAAISGYLQAEAGVTQARAALSKAQADSDRARDLFEHNAVARKEVLNAESFLTQSKAAVEQSLAGLEQAKRRLQIMGIKPGEFGQRLAVTAPISGKVLEMNVVQGEYRNDTSAPLMTVADLSSVWVTADVPETSIRQIRIGERLDVELSAYPGETFRAKVMQIADMVDPQSRTIKVRAELDNSSGRFRPEMFGRILHTEGTEARLVVPATAILQEEGQNVIWRQSAPGRFQRVAVQTGSRVGDRIAIVSGLQTGDRVVTDGAMLLKGN